MYKISGQCPRPKLDDGGAVVGQDGLEPSIFSVSEKRFNQLIYCPMALRAGLEPATQALTAPCSTN